MPYVQRDVSGQISVIYREAQESAREYLPNEHPDLQNFFGGIVPQTGPDQATAELTETDANLVRVIEDIVDILIEKNLIMFTDLPPAAREKIMRRKSTREHFLGNSSLVESEDKLF